MSELLKAALTAWIEWVDIGAPRAILFGNPHGFRRDAGLCWNARHFAMQYGERFGMGNGDDFMDEVQTELTLMFAADGFKDIAYPFGQRRYDDYAARAAQHDDDIRYNWVARKLGTWERCR